MKVQSRRMKLVVVLSVFGCALLAPYLVWAHIKSRVTIQFNNTGLMSLKYNGSNLLRSGDLRVLRVMMRNRSGNTFSADLQSILRANPVKQEVTRSFVWGAVATHYEAKDNRFLLTVTTTNKSDSTIEELSYEPLELGFPGKVVEYDGTSPLLGHNVGNPTLITLTYPGSVMVLANEDVRKPLLIGFPWALDRPANTEFPLRIETGRDPMLPDMLPYIARPIPPGGSETFTLSLRFGPHRGSALTLGRDVLLKFAAAFPPQLKWKDRRVIGTVTLAAAGLHSPDNPRGWFQDSRLDVTTEEGRADFRRRLLHLADSTILVLRDMNAQGMITWDIEGQEHPNAIYAGDPRLYATLAPEMIPVADTFFQTIRNAGFRVGVCIRPQQLVFDSAHKNVYERETSNPGDVLMQKIAWAKQHWGATLFYVQFNGDPSRPMDADILQRVAAAFPDVLLVPENKNLRYYAFSAPYFNLVNGTAATPGSVKAVYPSAFSLINTADATITKHRDDLIAAIKQGDVLMCRGWYNDPSNTDVRSLY